ncbi:MAG: ABC transporter ATP-binding protein [Bacteroidota bacterium]
MLKANNIFKSYGKLPVLKGVSLELEAGEVVALVGTSGAGKSTLLQILGTLDTVDQGEVFFKGKEVTRYSERNQAAFRNQNLGFVFQFHHLLPEFSALENVSIPAMIHGNKPQAKVYEEATALLERLGLGDRIKHRPSELSGGEQQRVSMARALINSPDLILADEPTGNLDSANSEAMYDLIRELTADTGVAFLIATHNLDLAAKADRVLTIKDGLLVD